jgi:Sulfotransferase family
MTEITYKVVWIAGMPRSASMWAFNITRSLLRQAGLTVLPRTVPKYDIEMVEEARIGLKDSSPNNVWCLKVHSRLQNASSSNRFISTIRDPRDAVVSFMRFTRYDFEQTLVQSTIWTVLCDHYRALPPELSLCLDYSKVISEPMTVASRISTFLGLELGTNSIACTVAEFERESVRRRIEAFQNDFERRRAAGDSDIADAQILNGDGTVRIWDPQTGFQSDHVSDYRAGDWRVLLTDDQKERLDQAIGDWLARHGYDRRLAA